MKIKIILITVLMLGLISLESCNSVNGNTHMENTQSQNSLLKAVANQDVQATKEILKSKPNLEVRDDKDRTALMIAIYNFDNEIAKLLIDAGADVNAQDAMENSPFLYAGAEGNVELLKMCLENGADFNLYNRYGGTALIPAAEKGHLKIVKILTKIEDYPIDHINKLGWTALLEAVILSEKSDVQTAIVKTLVEAGADINIADNDGVTPLQHARNKSLTEVVEILSQVK
ncbi:ankyrin repeat domain-containing protein [Weeksellaceae bacterium KMM 9713]|uniref:Ankyrin repeat domain-containing protein n=1 Tax=Profundicola chukchiensis TaxID=2961959 RepID=A0A9X4N0H0_9FLAO|nr:ankyrin repeat domain-containing protein [Profundicola chukchiensis]MDG4946430.1 ankyrin repeat domain-containing protein [Profundicola chukchiensis]